MFDQINLLDIVLAAVLLLFLVRSVMKGFVRGILGLVGLIAAVLLSAIFYQPLATALAQWLGHQGKMPPWLEPTAYGVILVAVLLVFMYLGNTLSKIIRTGPFSAIDRLLGAGVGLIKGILVCFLLINLLVLLVPYGVPASLQNSWLQPKILQAGGYLISLVPDELTDSLRERAARMQTSLPAPAPQPNQPPPPPTQ